eukprot:TRINITY_DN1475_c0_g1_i17.p1 TRINITY_DN1475_c0_g1~~TRINITY_DN1475_c0_g1_i17.p1  ORF type:complete len:118 (-),score=17.37 TRINITY_DN1475_c0_g1_i17:759-1112(-)
MISRSVVSGTEGWFLCILLSVASVHNVPASRLEKILLNNMPNEYRSYFNKTFTPAKTSSSKSKKSGKTSPREGEVCLSVCLSVGISFVVEIVLVVPIDCPYEHEESEGTLRGRNFLG